MSIDFETERCIPIGEAPKNIPGRPSLASVYRWMTDGVRGGVRLESLVVGGQRFTSIEAIGRFIARTTRNSPGAPVPRPTSRQREAAIRRAERELERAGI